MSTLTARRACRDRRQARLQLDGRCQCGQRMDRVGARCQSCTDRHARLQRPRYRRSDYGSAFTVSMVARSAALELRGVL